MDYSVTQFTPWAGLIGGALIGLASALMLVLSGRVAGVSGIAAELMSRDPRAIGWRLLFIAGLIIGALLYMPLTGRASLGVDFQVGMPLTIIGGFLVGFGTRMGSGCTAGHGICGISRLSPRSLIATAVFFATALITVFVVRHVMGPQ